MDLDQAWRSSKLRAWGVGLGIGGVGGVVAAIVGMFSGLCCLFQFANVLAPLVAGIVGGLAAGLLGKWSDMPGIGGAGAGAFLGLRGGALAAILTGIIGFTFALLWPVISAAWTAYSYGGDIVETLVVSLGGLAFSAAMSAVFAGGGTFVGLLLGVAAGAIAGAIRGQ